MKRLWILLVAMCALGLAACNTVEGFGKDVKKVGEKMEDAAARKK
jgi:entericidin A